MRTGAHVDVGLHAVAVEKSGGRIGDVEDEAAMIEVAFADVDGSTEILTGNVWRAIVAAFAAKLQTKTGDTHV
jgi:hypothetical protein